MLLGFAFAGRPGRPSPHERRHIANFLSTPKREIERCEPNDGNAFVCAARCFSGMVVNRIYLRHLTSKTLHQILRLRD